MKLSERMEESFLTAMVVLLLLTFCALLISFGFEGGIRYERKHPNASTLAPLRPEPRCVEPPNPPHQGGVVMTFCP